MVKVTIQTDSRFAINRTLIRQVVIKAVAKYGLREVQIGVVVVGDRKMTQLNQKWLKKEGTTDVLAFPIAEGDYLGDVVVCYPAAVRQAAERNVLVDDEVTFLVEHGVKHLLGEDHD